MGKSTISMAILNSESQWKAGEFLKRQALQEVGSFEVGMHGDQFFAVQPSPKHDQNGRLFPLFMAFRSHLASNVYLCVVFFVVILL